MHHSNLPRLTARPTLTTHTLHPVFTEDHPPALRRPQPLPLPPSPYPQAQWLLLFVGGLSYISYGMTMFTMSFTVVNPLLGSAAAKPSWRCTTTTSDIACLAVVQPGAAGRQANGDPQQLQGGHRRQLLRLAGDVVKDGGFMGAEDEWAGAVEGAGGAGLCGLERGQWTWLRPADSIVTEFDLVCGQEWKVGPGVGWGGVGCGHRGAAE